MKNNFKYNRFSKNSAQANPNILFLLLFLFCFFLQSNLHGAAAAQTAPQNSIPQQVAHVVAQGVTNAAVNAVQETGVWHWCTNHKEALKATANIAVTTAITAVILVMSAPVTAPVAASVAIGKGLIVGLGAEGAKRLSRSLTTEDNAPIIPPIPQPNLAQAPVQPIQQHFNLQNQFPEQHVIYFERITHDMRHIDDDLQHFKQETANNFTQVRNDIAGTREELRGVKTEQQHLIREQTELRTIIFAAVAQQRGRGIRQLNRNHVHIEPFDEEDELLVRDQQQDNGFDNV